MYLLSALLAGKFFQKSSQVGLSVLFLSNLLNKVVKAAIILTVTFSTDSPRKCHHLAPTEYINLSVRKIFIGIAQHSAI